MKTLYHFWQLLFFKIIFNFYCFGIGIQFDELQETKQIKMKNEIYRKHVYDLDLKSLLLNYEKGIRQVILKNTDKPPEYYIDQIKFSIDEYCHNNGIVFDNEVILLISPEANDIYSYFLALSLIFYEEDTIRQFLNYQGRLFIEKEKPNEKSMETTQEKFINIVEFVLKNAIKISSPFDNSKRVNIIMRWAEDKGMPKQKIKLIKEVAESNPSEPSLIWNGNPSLLFKLSEELYYKGYTNYKLAFSNVFNHQEKILWKMKDEAWVYLMYRLKMAPYSNISTSEGVKPYLSIGEKYFQFCDDPKEKTKKRNFSSKLYNITKRKNKKHQEMIASIDSILKYVFRK